MISLMDTPPYEIKVGSLVYFAESERKGIVENVHTRFDNLLGTMWIVDILFEDGVRLPIQWRWASTIYLIDEPTTPNT